MECEVLPALLQVVRKRYHIDRNVFCLEVEMNLLINLHWYYKCPVLQEGDLLILG